nr:MAG: ParB-like nuclease domain [Bacteriophage sp.]
MAFNLADMVNKRPKQVQQENTSDTVYRDVFELVPSKENFYGTDPDRLRGLKNSIQLFGVMQDVLIEDVNGEDHIISGHCRTMCCRMLVEEGHEEFRKINCKYTTVKDDTRKMLLEDGEENNETTQLLEKLAVIQANRFREKTDWEKMKEALETEEVIKGLRELTELKGKTRDMVRETIGVSGTQMERYHAVQKKLSPEWMKEFQSAKINITVARELADLDETYQKKAMEHYEDHDGITGAEIKAFKKLQENNRDTPGQFTIEQATGQQRPPENDTPVQPELQIERLFEALNKGERERVLKCDTRMAAYLISIRYRDVRIRNGHFNYQASKEGITFNPESTMQYSLTWNELSEELVKRFGKKQKPVRIVSVDAPEKPQSTLTEAEAVKALFEEYPDKLKTIMRICRQCKNNGEAAKAVQKKIAPYGWHAVSGREVEYSFMGFAAGLEITVKKEKIAMKYGRLVVEAKNLYNPYSPEFDAEEGRCQKAADQEENAAEKQQDKKSNTWGMIPSTWEEALKDIQVPTSTEITGYLYDEERNLKEILEVEEKEPGLPWMEIYRQQLIVGGLRIIKKIIESQEG